MGAACWQGLDGKLHPFAVLAAKTANGCRSPPGGMGACGCMRVQTSAPACTRLPASRTHLLSRLPRQQNGCGRPCSRDSKMGAACCQGLLSSLLPALPANLDIAVLTAEQRMGKNRRPRPRPRAPAREAVSRSCARARPEILQKRTGFPLISHNVLSSGWACEAILSAFFVRTAAKDARGGWNSDRSAGALK